MKSLHWLSIPIWLILLLHPEVMVSQEDKERTHQISLVSGYTGYTTYEPILSSVRQSATLFTSGLEYTLQRKSRHELGAKLLFFGLSDLTSRLSNTGFVAPNTGEMFGGSFESYYRKLIKESFVDIYLGVHLNGFYFDKSLDVISFDDARAADLFLDIGPSISIVKQLGKHQLKADVGLPLLGYVAAKTRNSETFPFELIERDKNFGTAIRYGDIEFVDDYFNLNFASEYSFNLTNRLLIGIHYGFQYYDYKKEEPFNVQAVSYRFLLQATYEF